MTIRDVLQEVVSSATEGIVMDESGEAKVVSAVKQALPSSLSF